MAETNDILAIAKSKIAARRFARKLGQADLARAIENLEWAAAEVKKSEDKKARKERAANLKKLRVMMDKLGLSASDVQRLLTQKKAPESSSTKISATRKRGPKKGIKVKPKYQIKDGKQVHKWTGRGRMPLMFREYIEQGGSLEKLLIK